MPSEESDTAIARFKFWVRLGIVFAIAVVPAAIAAFVVTDLFYPGAGDAAGLLTFMITIYAYGRWKNGQ